LKSLFETNWFNNFYDFFYSKLNDFGNIIKSNQNLIDLYENISWERISKLSKLWMLHFCEKIWFQRNTFSEISDIITNELNNYNIKYLNDFLSFWTRKFKILFSQNNHIKYFFERIFKKGLTYMLSTDHEEFWKKLWLKFLDEKWVLFILKNKLKNKWIFYLDDLEKIDIKSFKQMVWDDLLLKYYFENKWISKSFIVYQDIKKFWGDLFLERKKLEEKESIRNFLSRNYIFTFSDLENFTRTGIRSDLWEDPSSRKILEWFWLKYLQNFRYEHIIKFARYVWLPLIPKTFNYTEDKAKYLFKKHLFNNWVECIYSINLFW
jgi:hypothetical protein